MKKIPKTETASTKFTKEEKTQIHNFLEAESKRRGKKLTMGSFLNEAALVMSNCGAGSIATSNNKKSPQYDFMKDIIGSVTGGPSDLSTNPKHLEGFGEDSSSKRSSL